MRIVISLLLVVFTSSLSFASAVSDASRASHPSGSEARKVKSYKPKVNTGNSATKKYGLHTKGHVNK